MELKSKKAIILCMSCNQERYVNDEDIIRETWGKDIIDGKYDNLEIYFYRGGSEKEYFDEEKHIIHLTSDDDLYHTYNKSIDAFRWIKKNVQDYDYIIRTNTSTYINIDAILHFLNNTLNDVKVCGPGIAINQYSQSIPFLPGYFLIFSREIIDLFCSLSRKVIFIDDVGFAIFLYNVFKVNYVKNIIQQVDGLRSLKDITDENIIKSYFIRCETPLTDIKNTEAMRDIQKMYDNLDIKSDVNLPHNFTFIDTIAGNIPI